MLCGSGDAGDGAEISRQILAWTLKILFFLRGNDYAYYFWLVKLSLLKLLSVFLDKSNLNYKFSYISAKLTTIKSAQFMQNKN